MKAILIIDIPDDYDEYGSGDWYVVGDDDLRVVYEEDGALKTYKYIDDDMAQLKPLPQKKKVREINKVDDFMKSDIQIINEKVTAKIMLDTELLLASGYNQCLDDILGE